MLLWHILQTGRLFSKLSFASVNSAVFNPLTNSLVSFCFLIYALLVESINEANYVVQLRWYSMMADISLTSIKFRYIVSRKYIYSILHNFTKVGFRLRVSE